MGGVQAAEADRAFVLLHDAFADPEAEAGALRRFRSEKGLEEVPGVLGANALTPALPAMRRSASSIDPNVGDVSTNGTCANIGSWRMDRHSSRPSTSGRGTTASGVALRHQRLTGISTRSDPLSAHQ